MTVKISLALLFACGFAHGAQKIEIPVQTIDVVREQPSGPRWETYHAVPHKQALEMLSAANALGAACHELRQEQIVVCYYEKTEPKQVGFDWQRLRESMKENAVHM